MKLRNKIAALAVASLGAVGLVAYTAHAEYGGYSTSDWELYGEEPSRTFGRWDGTSFAVVEHEGYIYVGGKFTGVTKNGVQYPQANIARFTLAGEFDTTWRPDVDNTVADIDGHPDGDLLISGDTRVIEGQEARGVSKIDVDTFQKDNNFPGVYGSSSVVREVEVVSDEIYYVGSFTGVQGNGTGFKGAFRSDLAGVVDTAWQPQLDSENASSGGKAWDLYKKSDDEIFIVGWFTSVNGNASRHSGVSVDGTTGQTNIWDTFVPNYSCCRKLYGIDGINDTIIASGDQHGTYSYDHANGMQLIAAQVTSYDSRYQDSSNRRGGDGQSVRIEDDGRAYVGSHSWGSSCEALDGTLPGYSSNLANTNCDHSGLISAGIMALDANTGVRDQAFNPYGSGDLGGMDSELASDGALWIVGGYSTAGYGPGDLRSANDLVRLVDVANPNPTTPPPSNCTYVRDGVDVALEWDAAPGYSDVVIRREVEFSGTFHWRGLSSNELFSDSDLPGSTLNYTVESRSQVNSDPVACSDVTPALPDPAPVQSCTVSDDGINFIVSVQLDPAAANPSKVVYRRTVLNGNTYWRGTSVAAPHSFTDSYSGSVVSYEAIAKYGNSSQPATTCL